MLAVPSPPMSTRANTLLVATFLSFQRNTTTRVPIGAQFQSTITCCWFMRTHPALRYSPSSASVWIGDPLPRSGMPWNPMARPLRARAKRVMYGSRKSPPCALDITDFENTA